MAEKIKDEKSLKELSRHVEKSKRRNVYKVGKYSFQQTYSTCSDAFNPFKIYIYEDGQNVAAGAGPSIESAYENLILSLIRFKTMYLSERNELSAKLEKIEEIINEELHTFILISGMNDEQIGHDFWLTRNGHGAGFWDRGLGDMGEKLTEIAKSFGGCNAVLGDDGSIYLEGGAT